MKAMSPSANAVVRPVHRRFLGGGAIVAFAALSVAAGRFAAPGTADDARGMHESRPDSIILERRQVIDGSFGGLTALAVDRRGRIFAADFVRQRIDVFSPTGDRSYRIGREGEGPGEFEGLRDLAIARDSLFAYDNGLKRISVYSLVDRPELEYTTDLRTGGRLVANYGVLALRSSTELLVPFVPLTRPEYGDDRRINLRRVGPNGVEEAPVLNVPDREWLIMDDPQYGVSVSPLPFGRESLLRVGPNDRLYLVQTDSPLVRIFQSNGRLTRRVSVPRAPLDVTEEDLADLRRSYEEYLGRAAATIVYGHIDRAYEAGALPERKPFFKDFAVDDAGRIWLELLTPRDDLRSTALGLVYRAVSAEDARSEWVVVSSNGRRLGRAVVDGDVRLYSIANGTAYGVSTDALGVHRIVVYDIHRSRDG